MQIITILSVIPVIIWFFIEPLSMRFGDFTSAMTSIGQLLGILGMTLFAITLILSGRLKIIDRYLKGLDRVYVKHHILGAISFSMLLFHPLFLVIRYITISIRDAGLFFVPFRNIPITWGIFSLTIMIILISITFYISLKYNHWKFSHKFLTLAFILAIIHTFTISSDVSRNNFLRYYILIFSIIGLILSIRKAFLDKILKKKYKYKVKATTQLNEEVVEIEIAPVSKKINFTSGQFIFVSFKTNGLREFHPFTIASGDNENNLKLIIKNFGDFTYKIKSLKSGTEVLIDGPYGNFSYNNFENKDQIWIAGGIGITPFLSMSKVLDKDYSVHLYYSVKDKSEAVQLGELSDFTLKNKNFKFTLWSSNESGYITAEKIKELDGDLLKKEMFLCGPPVFMENIKNQLLSLGVEINKIHYENFNL